MDADRYHKLQTLFEQALSVPEDNRITFLKTACNNDEQLLDTLLKMLEADQSDDSILNKLVADLANEVLDSAAPIPDQIGPYRVIKELGRGGMGVVYLAERLTCSGVLPLNCSEMPGFLQSAVNDLNANRNSCRDSTTHP
jgi:eukaryotic-like serine/threonine-protein kinase